MCVLLSRSAPCRSLRSSEDAGLLSIPRFRTETYGRKRFSVVAPSLWNDLPADLRNAESNPFRGKFENTFISDILFRRAL